MPDFVCGLDLGQANDYSALAIVERERPMLRLRHLQRWPVGTRYPAIVEAMQRLLFADPLYGQSVLVVDGTGVGRAVIDLFMAVPLGAPLIPVTIVPGSATSFDADGYWHCPKQDLISTVQVLLQTGRLAIAEALPEASALVTELLSYEVKVSAAGHDTYNARSGQHDDMILAVALACWYAERGGGTGNSGIWV